MAGSDGNLSPAKGPYLPQYLHWAPVDTYLSSDPGTKEPGTTPSRGQTKTKREANFTRVLTTIKRHSSATSATVPTSAKHMAANAEA